MSEKSLMLVALLGVAYFVFVHGEGTAAASTGTGGKNDPPVTPQGRDDVAGAVKSGLDLVKSIFDAAKGSSTGSRGSGVATM